VDIIVVWATPAAFAAKQATSQIPIVMTSTADPVGTGLIASLARPSGNITGLSGMTSELGPKLLEFMREMLPATRRVTVLANAADPFGKLLIRQVELGGRGLGIAIQAIEARGEQDYAAAFAAMKKERADAVIVQATLPRKAAAEMAIVHRIAPISWHWLFPSEGGLMAYSPNQNDLYRRTAHYIDRILKGAQPAELPVEQPTRFELVINLKTAKALGIAVPSALLVRADEVIR
jgi:putative tryptophan/tyrosine transport system substrate-binding protein